MILQCLAVIAMLMSALVSCSEAQVGAPKVKVSYGDRFGGVVTWNPQPVPGTKDIAFMAEVDGTETGSSVDNGWMIVMCTAHLVPDTSNPTITDLLSRFSWLARPDDGTGEVPDFQHLRATAEWTTGTYSAALSDVVGSHLDALDGTRLLVDDGLFLQLLDDALSDDDAVKRWGQPFLFDGQASGPRTWAAAPSHWLHPGIGSLAHHVWLSTSSGAPSLGGAAEFFNVNRLVESAIRFQARDGMGNLDPVAGEDFLASEDYRKALEAGLQLGLQILTLRDTSSTASPAQATASNLAIDPVAFPGLTTNGGPLVGISVSDPIILTPALLRPDPSAIRGFGTSIVYEVEVGCLTDPVPGGFLLLAVGQSAEVTHARFDVTSDTVNMPLDIPVTFPEGTGVGIALVYVPPTAIEGSAIELLVPGDPADPQRDTILLPCQVQLP